MSKGMSNLIRMTQAANTLDDKGSSFFRFICVDEDSKTCYIMPDPKLAPPHLEAKRYCFENQEDLTDKINQIKGAGYKVVEN